MLQLKFDVILMAAFDNYSIVCQIQLWSNMKNYNNNNNNNNNYNNNNYNYCYNYNHNYGIMETTNNLKNCYEYNVHPTWLFH